MPTSRGVRRWEFRLVPNPRDPSEIEAILSPHNRSKGGYDKYLARLEKRKKKREKERKAMG